MPLSVSGRPPRRAALGPVPEFSASRPAIDVRRGRPRPPARSARRGRRRPPARPTRCVRVRRRAGARPWRPAARTPRRRARCGARARASRQQAPPHAAPAERLRRRHRRLEPDHGLAVLHGLAIVHGWTRQQGGVRRRACRRLRVGRRVGGRLLWRDQNPTSAVAYEDPDHSEGDTDRECARELDGERLAEVEYRGAAIGRLRVDARPRPGRGGGRPDRRGEGHGRRAARGNRQRQQQYASSVLHEQLLSTASTSSR